MVNYNIFKSSRPLQIISFQLLSVFVILERNDNNLSLELSNLIDLLNFRFVKNEV